MTIKQRAMATAAAVVTTIGLFGAVPAVGADYVADAETITEITQAVDYRPTDADTLRLYRAFLNREPDIKGSRYWIAQTRAGANLDDLAYGFAQSDEFKADYGTLTNTDFLTLIYNNMLGRVADEKGFAYWIDEMDMGLPQFGVVRWVVANPEFVGNYPFTAVAPGNPGDTKNCGDFATQADAQAWFDHYYPGFGDVAKLDGDNNLVPCES